MDNETISGSETIVAVFDTGEQADAAVRDLEAAGVPSSAIARHAGGQPAAATTTSETRPHGFWSNLFGDGPTETHADATVFDRSLQSGGTVVTVTASGQHVAQAFAVLERHNPVDIDERATSYGVSHAATATTATGAAVAAGADETLRLSEETIAVGKRTINRGTTRVRRYVVETPVNEQVMLRDETVTIDRRPVTDGRAAAGDDFSEKVIEVTETAEEAVVSKQAHVREEVVIRKDVHEHAETIHDTVRREDVEIVKEPAVTTTTATTATPAAPRV